MPKLYIVLVGLPARGKSFISSRLQEGLAADGVKIRVFNNGDLRRKNLGRDSSLAAFYHPDNAEGRGLREELALSSMASAREYLESGGEIAVLDATNGSRARRRTLEERLVGAPILFIECVNNDPELLEASIERKARLPEFSQMSRAEAVESFKQRIAYYEAIYAPLADEACYVKVDTLYNRILEERQCSSIPFYIQIRDILVSDWVRNLYLMRHGQSEFNVRGRIGGDSGLTEKGRTQAEALAVQFQGVNIPYIFTSTRRRAWETAGPLLAGHPESVHITVPEFDEIDAGIFDGLSYEDIRREAPAEYAARQRDKYGYVYPGGEGYATMKDRVARGFRKALFISGAAPGIAVIGHQAVNRLILSLFLFRRDDAVPYIYVPQNEYFHIVATHRKKILELVRFTG